MKLTPKISMFFLFSLLGLFAFGGCTTNSSAPVAPIRSLNLAVSVPLSKELKASLLGVASNEIYFHVTGTGLANPITGVMGPFSTAGSAGSEDFNIFVPAGTSRLIALQLNDASNHQPLAIGAGQLDLGASGGSLTIDLGSVNRNCYLLDTAPFANGSSFKFNVSPEVVDAPSTSGDDIWVDQSGTGFQIHPQNGQLIAFMGNGDMVNFAQVPPAASFFTGTALAKSAVGSPATALQSGDIFCVELGSPAHAWIQIINPGVFGSFGPSFRFRFNSTLPFYAYDRTLSDINGTCLTPAATPTATNTITLTLGLTATDSPTPTPSNTATDSPTPTSTNTPGNTATVTPSNSPTNSPTPSFTPTASNSPTNTSLNTPTNTPTVTSTSSATMTPTDSATLTPTNTPANTLTNSPTNTPTNTSTATPTTCCTPTFTNSATSSPTNSPTLSPTNTPTNTSTATPTPCVTPTFTNSATFSPTNSPTLSPTNTPTNTSTATPTPSFTTTFTNSATSSPTNSPTLSPTNTPTDTSTTTPTPSFTATFTNSATASPTATPTNTPTITLTNSPTATPTNTASNSPTLTFSNTASLTPTDTLTNSPTLTPSHSPTQTPTNTSTLTATNSPTSSPSNTPTDTPTPTLSPTNTPSVTPTDTPSDTPTPTPTVFVDITGNINSYPVIGDTTGLPDGHSQSVTILDDSNNQVSNVHAQYRLAQTVVYEYGAGAPDVVYQFTLATAQSLFLNICNAPFDSVLYLRTNPSDPDTAVAFNDDSNFCGAGGTASSLSTGTLAPGTYYLIVDGFQAGEAGPFSLTLSSFNPPCILTPSLPPLVPEAEPNNDNTTFSNATDLGIVNANSAIAGTGRASYFLDSTDVWRFQAGSDGAAYKVSLDCFDDGMDKAYFGFDLFVNNSGFYTLVGSSPDAGEPNQLFQNLPAGDYFVAVYAIDPGASQGDYHLVVEAGPPAPTPTPTDTPAPLCTPGMVDLNLYGAQNNPLSSGTIYSRFVMPGTGGNVMVQTGAIDGQVQIALYDSNATGNSPTATPVFETALTTIITTNQIFTLPGVNLSSGVTYWLGIYYTGPTNLPGHTSTNTSYFDPGLGPQAPFSSAGALSAEVGAQINYCGIATSPTITPTPTITMTPSAALPIVVGDPALTGNTSGHGDYFSHGSASAGTTYGLGAPDDLYQFSFTGSPRGTLIQFNVNDFPYYGAVYVRTDPNDPSTTIAVGSANYWTPVYLMTGILQPNTNYYIVVDGQYAGTSGLYFLQIHFADPICTVTPSAGAVTFTEVEPNDVLPGGTGLGTVSANGAVVGRGTANFFMDYYDNWTFTAGDRANYTISVDCFDDGTGKAHAGIYLYDSAINYLGGAYTYTELNQITQTLSPGDYHVQVVAFDSSAPNPAYHLIIQAGPSIDTPTPTITDTPTETPTITPSETPTHSPTITPTPPGPMDITSYIDGSPVSGNTNGLEDNYRQYISSEFFSYGSGAPDIAYSINLTAPANLYVEALTSFDSVIYLRKDPLDPSTTMAFDHFSDKLLNDENNGSAFVTGTLPSGTYYIIVDGKKAGEFGTFNLNISTFVPDCSLNPASLPVKEVEPNNNFVKPTFLGTVLNGGDALGKGNLSYFFDNLDTWHFKAGTDGGRYVISVDCFDSGNGYFQAGAQVFDGRHQSLGNAQIFGTLIQFDSLLPAGDYYIKVLAGNSQAPSGAYRLTVQGFPAPTATPTMTVTETPTVTPTPVAPIGVFGSYGGGNGQFQLPIGIAVNSAGTSVYVSDYYNNNVQIFTSVDLINYAYSYQWGNPIGSGPYQFSYPFGLGMDSSGHVFVTDTNNSRIQEYDSTGTVFVHQYGFFSGSPSNGDLVSAQNCAVDGSGNVYVTNDNTNSLNQPVAKFNSASPGPGGGWIQYWNYGAPPANPVGIAVNSAGTTVYLTEGNFIKAFSNDGSVLYNQWDGSASGMPFSNPYGLAVNSLGEVLVADSYNNRIVKFDAAGNYLGQLGSYGNLPGQFYLPYAIAVDGGNNIYVADSYNYRVQKLSPF